jgi:hypothetical protein
MARATRVYQKHGGVERHVAPGSGRLTPGLSFQLTTQPLVDILGIEVEAKCNFLVVTVLPIKA